jgi:hypothetical protein
VPKSKLNLVSFNNLNKEHYDRYGDGGKMTIRIQEEDTDKGVTKEKQESSAVYNILSKRMMKRRMHGWGCAVRQRRCRGDAVNMLSRHTRRSVRSGYFSRVRPFDSSPHKCYGTPRLISQTNLLSRLTYARPTNDTRSEQSTHIQPRQQRGLGLSAGAAGGRCDQRQPGS